jgi:hypothetical protein
MILPTYLTRLTLVFLLALAATIYLGLQAAKLSPAKFKIDRLLPLPL